MTAASHNAFAEDFLSRLLQVDEPAGAGEAERAGPWQVVEAAGGWAVVREGEAVGEGREAVAVFARREVALLAAAVLPGVGRHRRLELAAEARGGRYPVRDGRHDAGSLACYDAELVAALEVAGHLVRSPAALALVLEASGGTALRHAGRLLARRTDS